MTHPVFYVPSGDVLPIYFSTYDGGTGASLTMTGLAVTDIEIYKDASMTQRASDAGYALIDTDGIDIDGLTGIHGFTIDTGDNTTAGFFSVGDWFTVVVSAVTVDGQTVNFIAAQFRIMAAEGVAGVPDVNTTHLADTAQTGRDIGASVLLSSGTGTGQVSLSSGTVTAGAISAGAVNAAAIANGAIDAATFAADVDAEILSYLVDDATRIDASALNTAAVTSIPAILVDTGTTLQAELDGIQADTEDIQSKIGTPAVSLAADIAAIEAQTDDIGAAGAGLTAIPWNAAWDAQVESEVADALAVYDPPTNAELVSEINAVQADIAALTIPTAAAVADAVWLEAIADHSGSAGSTAEALSDAGGAGTPPTVGEIADAVWDEATSGHTTSGTFGEQVKTDIDAILADTNELQTDDYPTSIAAVKSDTAAILLDTAELQTDWANGGRLDLILDARASQTSVDDLPTNSELTTALASADDAVLAAIAALENLSAAEVNAEVDTALADYDAPTKAELDTGLDAIPTATENADALLKRDWTEVTGEAARSALNALRFLRNKWSIAADTLTVTKENDSTSAWTADVTTASGDPVSGVDPS